jgi:hypothetical protein
MEKDLDFPVDLSTSSTQKEISSLKENNIEINSPSNKQKSTTKEATSIKSKVKIDFTNFLSHAHNPKIVFFTLFFKGLAILLFLFLGIFGVSDSSIFIIVVILNALDFWFVKNVSGRVLVGLRWWNEVKENGSEIWMFESENEKKATSIDTTIFWMSLYITPCFWAVFIFLEMIGLRFMWFLLCIISFILTFSNTFGYFKCSRDQKKKIKGFLSEKKTEGLTKIIKMGVEALENRQ